jgi:sulfate adenylyltransferase
VKVLFVCTANICRSPYAEVVARRMAGPSSSLQFGSAGVRATDGNPMDPPMAAEAAGRGALVDGFRSTRLTHQLIDAADLILTAESAHRRWILEERPIALQKAFSLGQFARGLAVAEPGPADTLLERVRSRAATALPGDDVADPYGLGAAGAKTAAAEIGRLLAAILPAL